MDEFAGHLMSEKGLSTNTVETYVGSCRRFLDFLKKRRTSVADINEKLLIEFLTGDYVTSVNHRTVGKILSALRTFFTYLVDYGAAPNNPAVHINNPKGRLKLPRVLSTSEIDMLFASIDVTRPKGLRDRTILELVYSCGLRVSEVVSLKKSSLYLDDGIIRVTGKGDKQRIVPIGDQALRWLSQYNSLISSSKEANTSPYLFTGRNGKPLSRKTVWKRFNQLVLSNGRQASVHSLRHSFATHLLEGGANIRAVQELLGHASISTTQIYTHLNNTFVRKQHEMHHAR